MGVMPLFKRHTQPRIHMSASGEKFAASTATLASAAVLHTNRLGRLASTSEWQNQVWDLYDCLAEVRYGANWIGNACSRARLYVGKVDKDGSSGPVPVEEEDDPDEQLLAPLDELFGGQIGQSQMLRRVAVQLSIVGETFILGYDEPQDSGRVWQVASSDEIAISGFDRIKVSLQDADEKIELDLTDGKCQVTRLWVPHPRIAWCPDSPLLSLRSTAQEILDLSAHISASAKSRLAGAGLLFIPDSISFPNPDQAESGVNPAKSDVFKTILMEAMSAPIRDRDHPSAMVPIIISGPAEAADAIKWMTFSTPLDASASDLRDAAVRRLAVGLDLPSEILTGLSDANHWGAWMIEESAIKLHIEPMLGLIANALTTEFYQPALKAMGRDDWQDWVLWYDTTSLTQRPNRSNEALQAYEAGLLSDDATRRELGFSKDDAPSPTEKRDRLIEKVVLTNTNLAPVLLPDLGVETDCEGAPGGAGMPLDENVNPIDSNGQPPQRDGGVGELPGGKGILAASEMAVYRALSRCGQWLINRGGRSLRGQFSNVPLHEIHVHVPAAEHQLDQMLDGAYDEFLRVLPDEVCAHVAVDRYVRALLLAGHGHELRYLRASMQQSGCMATPELMPA